MTHKTDRSDTVTEDRVFDFFEMSQHLLTLIKLENSILEACGCFSLEAYLSHRDRLLKQYEEQAYALLSSINDSQQEPDGLHRLLIDEVSSLNSALNDNTARKVRTFESLIRNKAGDASWH